MSVGPSSRDELVIARRRPDSVTVAGVIMYAVGTLGLLSATALIVAAGSVVSRFQAAAAGSGASPSDLTVAATAIRSALLSSGTAALVLAVLTGFLARGVLHRNEAARIGALVLMAASLGCAMIRTSVTAFGGHINWTVGESGANTALAADVARAYSDAMPGWLVGIAGGLTDLQALGYIAVAVLLLAPASHEYFRTRVFSSPRPGPLL